MLDKVGAVHGVGALNEAFHGHPRTFRTIGKFNRVRAEKDNGSGGGMRIERIGPVLGFVLQPDIVPDGVFGGLGTI